MEKFDTEDIPKFTMPKFDSPKNFPEDYPGENGKYICKCFKCKDNFFGYKRRVICKICQESETIKDTNFNSLEKYFETTPKDQILKDWEETKHLDNIGIKISDFVSETIENSIQMLSQLQKEKEELIEILKKRKDYYEDLAHENVDHSHNYKKFIYRSQGLKEALNLIAKQ